MESFFQNFKCCFCKKFLSVGPVFSIFADEEELFKCGRCEGIECAINFYFERVTPSVNVPCSYFGCDITLPFGKMREHEKFCTQRTVQCINLGCSLRTKAWELGSHFKACTLSQHERVYRNNANFSAEPYQDEVFILELLQHSFVSVILFKSYYMYAGVFSLNESSNKISFTLTIGAQGKEDCSIKFRKDVILYDESVHCINCMRRHCELPNHKFSLSNVKCGENISDLPLTINFDLYYEILFWPSRIFYSVAVEFD